MKHTSMDTKIIFCHVPKTGGYSLLNWFSKKLNIYEYNDLARSEPFEHQIQKYQQASIIEIHGGSPQNIEHLRSAAPKAHELYISIVRNPIEQYESLCRDAFIHKAYLDLPLVTRGFASNDLESIYKEEYSRFKFDIHQMFNAYNEYWKHRKLFDDSDKDTEIFKWANTKIGRVLDSPLNPEYLFRRNNQFKYLVQTFGISFLEEAFSGNTNHILLTTEQLEKQFIWLLLNNKDLKAYTIFADYEGSYKLADITKRLKD